MLKVLYENKHVIVLEKPAGILSQSARDGAPDEETMLSLAEKQLALNGKGEKLSLIHRLDRGTGGVMVFSKTDIAAKKLSEIISDKERCIKEYLAVVSGTPTLDEGEMVDYLYKDVHAGKSFAISSPRMGAKRAALRYKVIGTAEGEKGPLSLVRVRLETGRTHQIRVQLSARGLPIVGDGKYGSRERVRGTVAEGAPSAKEMLALHAFHLAFDAKNIAEIDVTSLPDLSLYPFSCFESIIVDIAR